MATFDQVTNNVYNVLYRHLRARQDQIPATLTTVNQDSSPHAIDSNIPPPSQTSSMIGSPSSGGPTSSPLLFFVALGFGVVFTNLWIIVGVKYCFRYNARNRAMRSGNDVDPITLENMHARPHRRRREKKLMTMDEVNERFPLTKYKTWIVSRTRDGLPTSGGVSTPQSRAQSIKKQNTLSSPCPTSLAIIKIENIQSQQKPGTGVDREDKQSSETRTTTNIEPQAEETTQISEKCGLTEHDIEDPNKLKEIISIQTMVTPVGKHITSASEDEDDEDDQMNSTLPPELLPSPGDSCAICIDSLDEEDEIRGLSCDHVFHASCLDPWLTSRRASCPLCKADYYVPKTRPDGEMNEIERLNRSDRLAVPQHSQSLWNSIWAGSRNIRARFHSENPTNLQSNPNTSHPPDSLANSAPTINPDSEASQVRRWGGISSLTIALRNVHLSAARLQNNQGPPANRQINQSETSPSQLEAGIRR